ncbi:MAG TPA: FABP family protein [Pseudonocardiaceae bacterium]|nr:FABP family protein [Pseudonocardiaceae bacterium]
MNSDVSQPSPDVDAPQGAAKANLPWFDDLPIGMDAIKLGQGVELHPQCQPLAPLVGVWRGEGLAQYPSLLGEFRYGQQITFAHDGRPFLVYEARAWLLSQSGEVLRPAAREVGWWRVDEEETIEVVLAHMFGICEIYYGGRTGETAWELESDTIARTDTARETTAAARLYGIVENGDLAYAEERALRGLPLQPHLSAQLKRIAG